MTIYGKIVDGVLVDVGDLPQDSRRLDTLEPVYDLPGTGRKWMEACGWWDLEQLDLEAVSATLAEAVTVALAASDTRQSYEDKVHDLTALARSRNWDWIDLYCHGTVATIPFVQAQSPNAGIDWGTLSTLDKAERLRLGVSLALVELIRISQAVDLIYDLLAKLLERDAAVVPPSDR